MCRKISPGQLVFESPAAATGKKPEPDWTEPQKTEPLDAVVSGSEPVAVAVFPFKNYIKTACNRMQPVATDYHVFILYIQLYIQLYTYILRYNIANVNN
jgi:hypothetical protein